MVRARGSSQITQIIPQLAATRGPPMTLGNMRELGMLIDRHEVGQPNEFANWTDEELRAFIKSGTKPLGIVSGKTQH